LVALPSWLDSSGITPEISPATQYVTTHNECQQQHTLNVIQQQ